MDNREKIQAIALELFASAGYDVVGVQEIVDRAEITKPTLYHYFGSKHGLLEALLESNFSILLKEVKKAAEYKGDLPFTLTSVTKALFDFVKRNKSFYRMQLAMCFSSPESETGKAVAAYNAKLIRILEELFSEAVVNHGNMRGRQKRYAFTFLGAINNYITLYLSGHIKFNDEMVYNCVHQFSHGIYS
jgi:TetR/AcrR family transcriptional regulator